jgi:hypothetical protein
MAAYDDLPIKRIVVVGLLSIVVTAITVLGVQVLYFGMQNYADEQKLASSTYRESIEILEAQTEEVSRIGIDEQNGRIKIPVEQAMKAMAAGTVSEKANDTKSKKSDET